MGGEYERVASSRQSSPGSSCRNGRHPLGAGGCGPLEGASCERVLFIGNSYTDVNDLPRVFAELAASGGQHVGTGQVAPGGEELSGHVDLPETQTALAEPGWDVVVLQEQSQVPAILAARMQRMEPAARTLVGKIRAIGARPILFETWAHRDGSIGDGLPDFATMEAALEQGYDQVAADVGAEVAPVGVAWRTARLVAPQLDLWEPDGSHPTMAGTYLASCVMYATIFGRSPVGLAYDVGLGAETAHILQTIAAQTVPSAVGGFAAP